MYFSQCSSEKPPCNWPNDNVHKVQEVATERLEKMQKPRTVESRTEQSSECNRSLFGYMAHKFRALHLQSCKGHKNRP